MAKTDQDHPVHDTVPEPAFDTTPFLRHDYYGLNASRQLSVADRLRLLAAYVTVVPIKLACAMSFVIFYYVMCVFADAVLPEPTRSHFLRNSGFFTARGLLYVFGYWRIRWVYLDAEGKECEKPSVPKAFGGYVSNHCSWTDPLVYGTRVCQSYVTKKEVERIPMLGTICKACKCLFVDREARGSAVPSGSAAAAGTSALVANRMRSNYEKFGDPDQVPLALFPEATTTNGRCIMQFKRGAFVAGVPVQPLIIKYGQSGRVSPNWDTISGAMHILLMLTEFSFSVTVYVLPVYEPSAAEKTDAAAYAAGVRAQMLSLSGLVDSTAVYSDKRTFDKYVDAKLKLQAQREREEAKKKR